MDNTGKNKDPQDSRADASGVTDIRAAKRSRVDYEQGTGSLRLIVHPTRALPPRGEHAGEGNSELVQYEVNRLTLDMNPKVVSKLSERGEVGHHFLPERKNLTVVTININMTEFRRTMTAVLTESLNILYNDDASMRPAAIAAEIAVLVPATVSVAMTALYAKLRNVHRGHGVNPQRYPNTPSYVKDIELPLPIALAIESFGAFETNSLEQNCLYVPSYPENTQYEGRAQAEYPVTLYESYKPTFRQLKIPMKSIDPRLKAGTPWWTYAIENSAGTVDLRCILPPSLYTDFSTHLRMLFISPNPANNHHASDIVTIPVAAVHYGYRAKYLRRGVNYRTFLALAHFPEEFWSFK